MDVRKETLTGMLRTTGSKRVSVIIQDKKGRYLIAEKAGVEEEPIEFPSFSCKDAKLPEGDEAILLTKCKLSVFETEITANLSKIIRLKHKSGLHEKILCYTTRVMVDT